MSSENPVVLIERGKIYPLKVVEQTLGKALLRVLRSDFGLLHAGTLQCVWFTGDRIIDAMELTTEAKSGEETKSNPPKRNRRSK